MRLRSLTLAVMFVSILSAADPVAVGTWKFNPEKSKMPAEEAEKLKGRVVTFEVVGEKGMRMTTVNTLTGAKLVSISQHLLIRLFQQATRCWG